MVLVELHVPDFKTVKKYYGQLGFKVIWERQPEEEKGYLVLKLEDNTLCFWSGNKSVYNQSYFKKFPRTTKRGYAIEIVIMIKDIEEYYKKVESGINVIESLRVQPWGLKDFRVEDPFGFYLRFTSPHNILDPSNAVK